MNKKNHDSSHWRNREKNEERKEKDRAQKNSDKGIKGKKNVLKKTELGRHASTK